ncbi:hypothetical protein VTN00DRAFT_963 [Thermoascus crustaceus]
MAIQNKKVIFPYSLPNSHEWG